LATFGINQAYKAQDRARDLARHQKALERKQAAQDREIKAHKEANEANARAAAAAQAAADRNERELQCQAKEHELTQRLAVATAELSLANSEEAEKQRKKIAENDARLDEHAHAINHNADILDSHTADIAQTKRRQDREEARGRHRDAQLEDHRRVINHNADVLDAAQDDISGIKQHQKKQDKRLDMHRDTINQHADAANHNFALQQKQIDQNRKATEENRAAIQEQARRNKELELMIRRTADYRCLQTCDCDYDGLSRASEEGCRKCLSGVGYHIIPLINPLGHCRTSYCKAMKGK
jgi:hypothetical protein